MLQKIKNFLKRFLPASADSLWGGIERILGRIDDTERRASTRENVLLEQNKEILQRQSELLEQIAILTEQQKKMSDRQNVFEEQQKANAQKQENLIKEVQHAFELHSRDGEKCLQAICSESAEVKKALEVQRAEIVSGQEKMRDILHYEREEQEKNIQTQFLRIDAESALIKETLAGQNELLEKQQAEVLDVEQANQERLVQITRKTLRTAEEAVWAAIFKDTTVQSSWLKDKTFSAGRWAIGYQALYVMYRVLNESRPKRILELGLGQSTRMIAQYTAAFDDVEHIVIEHDPEWINFFKNDFSLSDRTSIVELEREMVAYKDAETVRTFKGFREVVAGKRFDFIFIDAPLGGDMKQFSRIDVLKCLPDCLANSFVILLDDCERSGEKRTGAEMEKVLRDNAIEFKSGKYEGAKDIILWASGDLKFLCTM